MIRNRSKFVVVLLALALAVGFSTMAAAEGDKWKKQKSERFSVEGVVTDVDVDASQLTLKLTKANRVLKPQLKNGEPVVFQVDPNAKMKTEGTPPGEFDLELDDITSGDLVRVLGTKSADGVLLITHLVLIIDN